MKTTPAARFAFLLSLSRWTSAQYAEALALRAALGLSRFPNR